MLDFKYVNNWGNEICNIDPNNKSETLTWHDLKSITLPENVLLIKDKNQNEITLQVAKNVIEKILISFDVEDTLYGLFKAIWFSVSAVSNTQHRVSPFIATHSYCIKVINCKTDGSISMNISPIYHLGPDYANEYKQRYGTEIDAKAIIGLIELPAQTGLPTQPHKTFNLGIDAGIAFKDLKIQHNKKLNMNLIMIDNGIMATLSCEEQTTSKGFTWEQLGLKALHKHKVSEPMPQYTRLDAI